MMTLKLQQFENKINALGLRERVLIFMTAALALVTLLYGFLINPLLMNQKKVAQQITETQAKISALNVQIRARLEVEKVDPNEPLRARLEQLNAASTNLNQELQSLQSGLVTPQQMPMFMKDILSRHHSLRLLSMKTLPTQGLGEAVDAAKTGNTGNTVPAVGAYKHGFEIMLQGGYLDMLGYLAAIEASPWRVFWGSADLNAETAPKTILTLKIYTLSMDKEWLTL